MTYDSNKHCDFADQNYIFATVTCVCGEQTDFTVGDLMGDRAVLCEACGDTILEVPMTDEVDNEEGVLIS